MERDDGFVAAQEQVQDYLLIRIGDRCLNYSWSDSQYLMRINIWSLLYGPGAGAEHLPGFQLLDEMKGETKVPCVLFMPATTEGASLRFMGIAENEGRGSYHTKVYAE